MAEYQRLHDMNSAGRNPPAMPQTPADATRVERTLAGCRECSQASILRLGHGQHLIRRHVLEHLLHAARPLRARC